MTTIAVWWTYVIIKVLFWLVCATEWVITVPNVVIDNTGLLWTRTLISLPFQAVRRVFPSPLMAFHYFLCVHIPYSQTQLQFQSNNRGWDLTCSCLRSLCKQCWKMAFVQRGTPLMTLHEKTSVFGLVFAEQNTFLFITAYRWITTHLCCLQYGWQWISEVRSGFTAEIRSLVKQCKAKSWKHIWHVWLNYRRQRPNKRIHLSYFHPLSVS